MDPKMWQKWCFFSEVFLPNKIVSLSSWQCWFSSSERSEDTTPTKQKPFILIIPSNLIFESVLKLFLYTRFQFMQLWYKQLPEKSECLQKYKRNVCKPRYLRWLLKKAVSVVHRWTVLWSCTNRIISIECTWSTGAESFIVMIGGKEQTLLSPLVHLALTKCYLTSPTEPVGKLLDCSVHSAQLEKAPIFKWNGRNEVPLSFMQQ